MARRKTLTVEDSAFYTLPRQNIAEQFSAPSEESALAQAESIIRNDHYYNTIYIYKLVKIVEREKAPVKVKAVSF